MLCSQRVSARVVGRTCPFPPSRRYIRGCGPTNRPSRPLGNTRERARKSSVRFRTALLHSPDAPVRLICRPRRTPSPAVPNYMGDVLSKCFAQNEPHATHQKPPSGSSGTRQGDPFHCGRRCNAADAAGLQMRAARRLIFDFESPSTSMGGVFSRLALVRQKSRRQKFLS